MDSKTLRRMFLDFFVGHGHEEVCSSAVVPKNDPTLLFANAGMNQFKEVFLGHEVRSYKRATSAQKCVRAGGKHNDLDEVGKDGRHLTFFEMLGNWSFGDYGKRDAIKWAWEFLTKNLGLPVERLTVSVYKDDDESYAIWQNEVGLDASRIVRLGDIEKGDEENFWSMGPVGSCGPCTEIYYDKQPEKEFGWGVGFDEDRYIELWNLVFMSFNRDESGVLSPLKMQSVDTGMGLERILAVMQGVESVYETDLFCIILERISLLLGDNRSQAEILRGSDVTAYRVIADHIRTLTFAVSEGQPFSNEGRGYVLRRILRRAVRFGRSLGFDGPFLYKVSEAVVEAFGDVYPEISHVAKQTQEVLRVEEERFFRTLDRGIARFEEIAEQSCDGCISGKDAFILYDTFGFPVDLTEVMAEERGMRVDLEGFREALEEQRRRSSESAKFHVQSDEPWVIFQEGQVSTFVGYGCDSHRSKVLRYRQVEDFVEIIVAETPFYAESGGQVGDRGRIIAEGVVFDVIDTVKSEGGIVHLCKVEEGFVSEKAMGSELLLEVSLQHRRLVAANHTATHLLHAALRKLISDEIFQAGSMVSPERLRFDFSYPKGLSRESLKAVEKYVNDAIFDSIEVEKIVDVPIEEAKSMGAMAIFGEKYGDRVRVLRVGDRSVELCGGIHVQNTRDIMCFRIVSEGAIASGTRRIEAVTSFGAFERYEEERDLVERLGKIVGVDQLGQLEAKISRLVEEKSELEKALESLSQRYAAVEVMNFMKLGREVGGVKRYGIRLRVRDRKSLMMYGDMVRDRMGSGIAVLGCELEGKVALLCIVSDDCVKAGYQAGKLVNLCAGVVGGKGGGKANMAQAGGHDVSKIDEALERIYGELS